MTSMQPVNNTTVLNAVSHAIHSLPNELQQLLALTPVPDDTYKTPEGDWVVPVASGASPAMQKSHQLHRILSDIQHKAENELSNTMVTIILAA